MQPSRTTPRGPRARAGLQWWVVSLGLATLAAGAWYGARRAGWIGAGPAVTPQGAPVRRGPLRISVIAHGNLKAADSVSLKCEVEGRTAILSLAPEGKHVQQGELVCELDATALVERRFQQVISAANADAALVKARQNREIQQSQNRSDIARAKQSLDFARQDVTKFVEGERAFERDKVQQSIDLAREDAARAQDKLAWSEKLAAKGFLTATELDADRVAAHRSAVELEQAQRTLDLLDRYQMPRRLDELQAALEEAQREAERVELQAKARLIDFDAEVRNNEARLELEQQKLAQVETQIEKAKIRAPRAGMVVYAQRDHDEPPIQEGTEVRERQEIMTIPSTGGMVVQAKLHESVVKQVVSGSPCVIKMDALGGQPFEGRVDFVSLLPDQNSWWSNPNTRVYRTDILITNGSDEMRPGMSCSVEILLEELPDAIHVPLQAVTRVGDVNVCFVAAQGAVERREVQVGRFNAECMQILSGAQVGERVLMCPPAGFDPGTETVPDREHDEHAPERASAVTETP